MIRYIDADKLRKDEIARCHCVPVVGSGDNNYKDLDEVLNEQPTADVVEVVRCKDCKHLEIINSKEIYARCRMTDLEFKPFDIDARKHYCRFGERREK